VQGQTSNASPYASGLLRLTVALPNWLDVHAQISPR
jgi:hypothetical protein